MFVIFIAFLHAITVTSSCNNCSVPDSPCRCDDVCGTYNDCCQDTPSGETPSYLQQVRHLLQCESVVMGDTVSDEAYYMISSCTDGSSCDGGMLPVTDVTTGLTYYNVHCAVCGGVDISSRNVVVWSTVLVCDAIVQHNTTIEALRNNCTICTFIQDTIDSARWCIPTVDSCTTPNTNCTNGYYSPVTANGTVYHNSYCAECNGQHTQDCFKIQQTLSVSDRCSHIKNGDGPLVLLHVTVTLPGHVTVTGGQITQTVIISCETHEAFDIASLQCVGIECPPGKTFQGGVCQNNNNYEVDTALIITLVGCAVSLIGSAAILLTYALFNELRNLPSKLLMSLVIIFILNDSVVLLSTLVPPIQNSLEACSAVAIVLHVCFLCRFSWTTILGIEYLRILCSARDSSSTVTFQNRMLILYGLLGWGVPLSIVVVNVTVTYSIGTNVYGLNEQTLSCWLVGSTDIIVVAIVPIVVFTLLNTVLFLTILYLLCWSYRRRVVNKCHTEQAAKQLKRKRWAQLRAVLAIFVILCTTGVFNISSTYLGTNNVWVVYTFMVLNSLQSLVVFVAFLCSKRVGRLYLTFIRHKYNWLCSFCCRSRSTSNNINGDIHAAPSSVECITISNNTAKLNLTSN